MMDATAETVETVVEARALIATGQTEKVTVETTVSTVVVTMMKKIVAMISAVAVDCYHPMNNALMLSG